MNYFLFSIMSLSFIFESQASEIQSQTSATTGGFAQEISYSGDTEKSNLKESDSDTWNWNASYSYSTLQIGATTTISANTNSADSDLTQTGSAGFGYSHDDLESGLDLTYSRTKEENLSSFGPSLHLGYLFFFSPKKIKEKEEFSRSLNLTVTGGSTNYTQDYSTVVRKGSLRKPTAVTKAGTQEIRQNQIELAASFAAWSFLDFKLSFTEYGYNKDVNAFLAKLDDPRAVKIGASRFGSTLTGFSANDSTVGLTSHLPYELDLDTDFTLSASASGAGPTRAYKASLNRTWAETWKTGLGFERDEATNNLQNEGIVTVAYEF